jgi:hypothetical protein
MNIELINPSAFHALRVSSQNRARNVVDKAPAAPAPKKALSRSELEVIGSEIVMVPSKGTAREGGVMRAVVREVPTPFFRTCGYETLPEYLTDRLEKQTIEGQHAAAAIVPRGERVADTWGALEPRLSIPPGGKALIPLEEHTRIAVSCDESVMLQISNTSNSRTLRLRTLDTASGEVAHAAFIPQAKDYSAAAIVSASGTQSAIIELMPQ